MRSTHSKPSPFLRKAISAYSDGQRRGMSPQTGVNLTGEGPSQLKHQAPHGPRIGPSAQTRTLRRDGIPPREVQPPQQEPSSERNDSSEQFDARPVTLKAADSDVDRYFNDEDNDAFLAIEDSVLMSSGAGTTRRTEIGCNVDRNTMKSESSPGGTRPQPAAASVKS
jgi:hypothetical protein